MLDTSPYASERRGRSREKRGKCSGSQLPTLPTVPLQKRARSNLEICEKKIDPEIIALPLNLPQFLRFIFGRNSGVAVESVDMTIDAGGI